MPLTASDLIALSYTPDMTQAGLVYAEHALVQGLPASEARLSDRLRGITAGKAAELGFRRYLGSQEVAYSSISTTPFTDPERCDVALGGRKCDLHTHLIHARQQIQAVRRNPSQLLQSQVVVPSSLADSSAWGPEDLFIFTYVTGLIARRPEQRRVAEAGQPLHMIHPLPASWSQPGLWKSFGQLAVKAEAPKPLTLVIGGKNEQHGFMTESVQMEPLKRIQLSKDFFSLAYMQVSQCMEGRVGMHLPRLRETYLVRPTQWSNIWVYGMDIYLVGYIRRGDYLRRAALLPPDSPVEVFPRTHSKYLSLPAAQLAPISDLIKRVKEWEKSRRQTEV